MNINKYRLHIALVVAVTLTASCGSNPTHEGTNRGVPYELSEDYANNMVRYTVQRDDRLSDIALEFTGAQSNWRSIAAHNGINNPRKLRAGAVLEIPTALIPGYDQKRSPGKQQAKLDKRKPAAKAPLTTSLAVKRAAESISDNNAAVVVQPVKINRNFELNPISKPVDFSASEAPVIGQRYIKVVGTYYPKGIYSEPAAYSNLLMRVAPGTQFVLERQMEHWYKVMTDDGSGYIRITDGQLIAQDDS